MGLERLSMACTIERPTITQLWEDTATRFSANVLGGAPIIPESNEYYAVAVDVAMQQDFFAYAEQMWREKDPRYACCDNLIAMAKNRGVYPNPAAFAQGYVQITGTPGTTLTQGLQFRFEEQTFEPVSIVPDVMPDSGVLVLRIAATDAGDAGNINATSGVLLTQIPGIATNVTSFGGTFCGGAEAEDCEQFRSRYLERLAYRPRLSLEWLKEKVKEWPCVTDVHDLGPNCCETNTVGDVLCPNKIEFYVLFRNTFDCGLAPQCVVDEITDWLFGEQQGLGLGEAEFGICGRVRTATAVSLNITLNGLACATPAQGRIVQERIRDYINRIAPATTLKADALRFIGLQVLGGEAQFDVVITSAIANQPGVYFDQCGDAVIDCDYKACIGSINAIGGNVSVSGCL